MITNIIDGRKRPYRWLKVNAIAEATAHDNSVADSDQASPEGDQVIYETQEGISVAEAVNWAQSLPGEVTLFLYDLGDGFLP